MADRRILIDTGAIYAFVTRSDPNHAAARSFVGRRGVDPDRAARRPDR